MCVCVSIILEFFEISLILFIEIDLVNTIIDEIDIINSKEKTWLD